MAYPIRSSFQTFDVVVPRSFLEQTIAEKPFVIDVLSKGLQAQDTRIGLCIIDMKQLLAAPKRCVPWKLFRKNCYVISFPS